MRPSLRSGCIARARMRRVLACCDGFSSPAGLAALVDKLGSYTAGLGATFCPSRSPPIPHSTHHPSTHAHHTCAPPIHTCAVAHRTYILRTYAPIPPTVHTRRALCTHSRMTLRESVADPLFLRGGRRLRTEDVAVSVAGSPLVWLLVLRAGLPAANEQRATRGPMYVRRDWSRLRLGSRQ